jgi:hypothetical protein
MLILGKFCFVFIIFDVILCSDSIPDESSSNEQPKAKKRKHEHFDELGFVVLLCFVNKITFEQFTFSRLQNEFHLQRSPNIATDRSRTRSQEEEET